VAEVGVSLFTTALGLYGGVLWSGPSSKDSFYMDPALLGFGLDVKPTGVIRTPHTPPASSEQPAAASQIKQVLMYYYKRQ
jgi:hypothetical protein